MIFRGSGVALVTPFDQNNQVDYAVLEQLIDYHLQNSTDALIIAGTTGEASTLTEEERFAVLTFVVQRVGGRIPVIAGAGSNNTMHAIDLSRRAQAIGADALLIVTPYYNKTSRRGIIAHYAAIAESVDLPIILYTVPSRTGVHIPLDAVVELSKIPNIVGIKDATGDLAYATAIVHRTADDFALYIGNDDLIVPSLSIGSDGVISVLANVLPQETHDLCQFYFDGKIAEAGAMQRQLLALIQALFAEANPIPVKSAMQMLGYQVGSPRLPLTDSEQSTVDRLRSALTERGVTLCD